VANPPINGGGLATKEGLSVSFHSGHRNQRHHVWPFCLCRQIRTEYSTFLGVEASLAIGGAAILNLLMPLEGIVVWMPPMKR
jgi:hypothetical protein